MDYDMFYSHCLIRGNEHEFCIDHDEEATLVSTALVKELDLPSYRHPRPYYKTFSGRRVHVTRQAWVSIDLNGYNDDLFCDVFPMRRESIVFGQAWLREYKVRYDSSRTRYSFYGMGKTYVLEPSRVLDTEVVHELMDIQQQLLGKMTRTFEKLTEELTSVGFTERVMADANRRWAEYQAEQKLKKTMNTHFLDTCATVEALNYANVDVASKDEVLVDDATKMETLVEVPDDHRSELVDETVDKAEKGSDFHSFGACLSPISSPLQVHQDPTNNHRILDTPYAAPIFRVDDLYIVDSGGKPKHTLDDPYLVHVDVSHYLCLYGYLATFHGSIDIYIEPPDRYYVPLVKPGAATSYAVGAELFIRILFDPGISLEFILGSSDVVHDGALFYDILLIRGRILSNREGMI